MTYLVVDCCFIFQYSKSYLYITFYETAHYCVFCDIHKECHLSSVLVEESQFIWVSIVYCYLFLFYFVSEISLIKYESDPPENCHLTVKKIAKNCHFC